MKFSLIILISLTCIFFIGCKSVLETEPTNEDLFTLTVEFDSNRRIVDTLPVNLSWSDITIDNFKEIKLTRINNHRDPLSYPSGKTENGWITILRTDNPFITSYVDTVDDDAEFLYRIEYIDLDNNFKRAENKIQINPTTHLTVPTDEADVKTAVESYIIDDGDSVLVEPGLNKTYSFSFLGKNIHLSGKAGAHLTSLAWEPQYTESGKLMHDSTFVQLNTGIIQGLTLSGGYAYHGGGINATGNAVVRQCRIKNNHAGIMFNGGLGGGVYLSGSAKLINCLIDSNSADKLGDGIYVDELAQDVKIINCTLANNGLYTNSSNLTVMNTSIIDTPQEVNFYGTSQPVVEYSYAGIYWTNISNTNVSGDIGFIGYSPLNPHLQFGSVCIDSGSPDLMYNDVDGTRNDIGAYGGPLGGW